MLLNDILIDIRKFNSTITKHYRLTTEICSNCECMTHDVVRGFACGSHNADFCYKPEIEE